MNKLKNLAIPFANSKNYRTFARTYYIISKQQI